MSGWCVPERTGSLPSSYIIIQKPEPGEMQRTFWMGSMKVPMLWWMLTVVITGWRRYAAAAVTPTYGDTWWKPSRRAMRKTTAIRQYRESFTATSCLNTNEAIRKKGCPMPKYTNAARRMQSRLWKASCAGSMASIQKRGAAWIGQ